MESIVSAFAPVRDADRPAFLVTRAKTGGNRLLGRLVLQTTGWEEELCLSQSEGDYDGLTAVEDNGTVYAVAGMYDKGARTLRLYAAKPDRLLFARELTAHGKWDHPFLCRHGGKLFLACDRRHGDAVDLHIFCVDPRTGEIVRRFRPTVGERAYHPVLQSSGSVLYLAYESFFAGRYHLMVRVLEPSADRFSEAVEAGCDQGNDNTPFLCPAKDGCYLCWENSSPLFAGDCWESPGNQPPIRIPSYGHGWRVRSKLMLRRLSYREGILSVEIPLCCEGRNAPVFSQTSEDAGEASLFVHDGQLFLLFVENAGHSRYRAAAASWKQDRFVRFELPEILLYDRKNPVSCLDGDELLVYSETDGYGREEYRVALPPAEERAPSFRTDKAVSCRTLRGTPGFLPPARETVAVEGNTLSLFWGDLHMHSNASLCSRHPLFHCTNVEEKDRFSRDNGGLDFCLLTDHDAMNDVEWVRSVKAADFCNEDHSFTAFSGYEWTSSGQKDFHNYGHYNILYRDSGILRRVREGGFDNLQTLWNALTPGEVLTIPHHPGEGRSPLDWDYFQPELVRLVEIYQVRGSYEYDGCAFDPRQYGRAITPGHSVQAGLKRGYRFGFTGGGEHEGVGLTGVFAQSLTRDGIFEALYHRRTYATTSVRLFATFFVDNCFLGGEIPDPPEEVTLSGAVHGTDDIAALVAVSNLGERDVTACYRPETGAYRVRYKTEGVEWIYLRIRQTDGNMAWVSPIFLGKAPQSPALCEGGTV